MITSATAYGRKLQSLQNKIISDFTRELCGALIPEIIVPYLKLTSTIDREQAEIILEEVTSNSRIITLLRMMKDHEGWWDKLLDYLECQYYTALKNKMEAALLAASNLQ